MGWKKLFKVAVIIAAVVVTGPLAGAIAGALGGVLAGTALSVVSGAIAGALVGGVSAAITGGDWKKGALMGGIGGAVAGGFNDFGASEYAAKSRDFLGTSVAPGGEASAQLANAAANPSTVVDSGPFAPGEGGPSIQTAPTQPTPPAPGDSLDKFTGSAVPKGPEVTASGPQVTKSGMLDRITDFTKAHPWTQDVLKSGAEAAFKGIAAANTPTEAEQAMEVMDYKNRLMNQSLAGVSVPWGQPPKPGQVAKPQTGMLRFPGGG